MVSITFIEQGGEEHKVEGAVGQTLMEVAKRNNIPGIPADCGGACACATCHVWVTEDWVSRLPEISEEEDTMIEFGVEEREQGSRLSCQIPVTDELEGIVLRIPASQI